MTPQIDRQIPELLDKLHSAILGLDATEVFEGQSTNSATVGGKLMAELTRAYVSLATLATKEQTATKSSNLIPFPKIDKGS